MIGAVNRLGVEVRRGLSQFAVGSKEPSLGFDFIDNTYLADGTKNLSQALTHSRSGNATMTDGYGPELITNGTFDTDSDWTIATGWEISGGKLRSISASNATKAYQLVSTKVGVAYLITVDVDEVSGTFPIQARDVNQAGTVLGFTDAVVGTNQVVFTAASTTTAINIDDYGSSLVADNVSVREMPAIKWAPHNLLTYSEDLTGADWGETGTASVDDFETISFSTDDGSRIQNTGVSASAGPEYTVEFDYISDGTFEVLARAASVTQASNTAPASATQTTHTLTVPAGTSGIDALWFRRNAGFTATEVTIRNVRIYRSDLGGMVDNPERGDSYVPTAVRPFGPELVTNGTFDSDSDWTKGTGWTIGSGVASSDGTQVANSLLEIDVAVKTGEIYVFNVDLLSRSAGAIGLSWTGASLISVTPYVAYTATGKMQRVFSGVSDGTATLRIVADASFIGSVDNASFKQSSVDPSAARYLPRVGHHVYNGDAWVNEGLLHESESRTNLVTYSEDFTDASWVKTNTATLAVDAVGPDGQTSAVTFVDSGAGGTGYVYVEQAATVLTSTTYTFSAFAKSDQASGIYIRAVNFTTPANGGCFFDLSNGTVGDIVGSGYTPNIQNVGNGWYRCSITLTTDATDTTGVFRIYASDGSTVGDELVDLDGTSSVLIYGAQLEQASTPSSYIPTAGATVTRAAETLTVPAANLPWPYPEVISDELFSGFTTVGSGWTDNGDGTYTGNATDNSDLYSSFSANKTYKISFSVTGGLAINTIVGAFGGGASVAINSDGDYTFFISTASNPNIGFFDARLGVTIDNISVREINPLSVSIQMDGRMTYADEDESNAALLYYWNEDNSNYIRSRLKTSSTATGELGFLQAESGTNDLVETSATYLNPDVLVPYNIAGRYGSTFINGAVDGVALTANTTPTTLPDLSSTDLELGYNYMGTIGTFRVWNQDLGDDGIVTASAPSLEPSLSLTFDGSGSSFTVLDWSE